MSSVTTAADAREQLQTLLFELDILEPRLSVENSDDIKSVSGTLLDLQVLRVDYMFLVGCLAVLVFL